jgi:capsular polysaccharide biosynthesis protein
VASFVAAGDDLSAASNKLYNRQHMAPETQADVYRSQDVYDKLYSEFAQSLSTAKLHYSKVQLYTNPVEKETENLLLAMNAYIDAASSRKPSADLGNAVVAVAQKIIKNEWVRVKSMKL